MTPVYKWFESRSSLSTCVCVCVCVLHWSNMIKWHANDPCMFVKILCEQDFHSFGESCDILCTCLTSPRFQVHNWSYFRITRVHNFVMNFDHAIQNDRERVFLNEAIIMIDCLINEKLEMETSGSCTFANRWAIATRKVWPCMQKTPFVLNWKPSQT